MGLFFWKNRSEKQADEIAAVLSRLAAGEYGVEVRTTRTLTPRVAAAIRQLQEHLANQRAQTASLAAGLQKMIVEHTAGDLDAVIAVDTLREPYRSIASDINALVGAHIAVKMQVVRAVSAYADGDFSIDMERLPGKKAQVTAAVDRAKAAFVAVHGQVAESDRFIGSLAEMHKQHELGWIDEQIPTDTFEGGSKRAAELVNTLVRAHIDVKMKIVELVMKYAHGDFSESMPRLPGKKAQITEAMEKIQKLLPRPDEIAEMRRIKMALDNVSSGVVIADASNTICYANRSVVELLRAAEPDMRKDMPGFRAERLLTSKLDQFERESGSGGRFLNDGTSMQRAEVVIGGHTLALVANPVFDEAGARLGAVVEFTDRTAELRVEQETAEIVRAASAGDFTKRIDVEGKSGFFLKLAEGMNSLLTTCDAGLGDVVRVLGALAKGDLRETITGTYSGTFGRLKDDSNATVESLSRTVVEIKESAETVSSSAREISAGNTDLSQRTEEQAASLEETASSMEQLTETVRQNTENAKHANELAIGASAIAIKGGEVVGEVVETMAAINDSAKKIVDIISTIDGIAFQTNILALNAAVEAARAGEQGRGFAVVAGEVRTLAARSAAAAKEIKALIGDSVDKTTTGSKLVDQAGHTMAEVVAAVKRVTDIMAAIAAASEEQGTGIEQVNEAVSQMDKVTQQNAALVEQVAASAEALEERAQVLVGLVSVFTLAGTADTGFGARAASSRAVAPVRQPTALAGRTPLKRLPATASSAAATAPARTNGAAAANDSDWSSF